MFVTSSRARESFSALLHAVLLTDNRVIKGPRLEKEKICKCVIYIYFRLDNGTNTSERWSYLMANMYR